MSILEVHNVSIRYITGDFKEIGLKEYVMRKLKRDYHVQEFWADKDISFSPPPAERYHVSTICMGTASAHTLRSDVFLWRYRPRLRQSQSFAGCGHGKQP